jgi:NADP-dependent 3-hydroxy acid dehydrogenase YdfG
MPVELTAAGAPLTRAGASGPIGRRVTPVRTAIVTGGTAGIGLAIAEAFGALGWRVAIGARRAERLEPALAAVARAGGHGFGHVLDVTDADSIDAFAGAVEKALGPVGVLVNNAGSARPGRLHELPVEHVRAAVETNLLGALLATRRVLQGMLAHGEGGDLVFVSSRAAAIPWPRHTPYGAAKAGMESAAAALRAELEGTGIRSTVVRVGDTITEFGSSWTPAEFAHVGYWHGLGLVKGAILQPAQVAAAVVAAVTAPPGVQLDTIVVNPQLPRQAP